MWCFTGGLETIPKHPVVNKNPEEKTRPLGFSEGDYTRRVGLNVGLVCAEIQTFVKGVQESMCDLPEGRSSRRQTSAVPFGQKLSECPLRSHYRCLAEFRTPDQPTQREGSHRLQSSTV